MSKKLFMKPLKALALPGIYLFGKYNQYKRERQQSNVPSTPAENELSQLNTKIDAYKRTHWTLLPRGFIDDVEAFYDPAYRQANPNPQFTNFPTDPKARRIRRRSEKWIWFFQHLANKPKIIDILRELNKDFRRCENISLRRALSASEEIRFTDFKRSACFSLAEVHEIGSFLVHGEATIQLFIGDLNNLNILGPQDLYLKPVLRALLPAV